MIIYKITNIINNKIYIGKTTKNINIRFNQHIKESKREHSNHYICRSIKKHGKENFIVETLETCNSFEELNSRERFWIRTLNCKAPNGYNISDGGDGSNGHIMPLNSRKKLSLDRKGIPLSENHIRSIIEGMKNMSDEKRNNMKTCGFGNKNNFYGKHHSEITKNNNKEKHYKKVAQYDKNGILIKIWNSRTEVSNHFDIPIQRVSECIHGKINNINGFLFKDFKLILGEI
jgi:group I intron endonuclease